ncbi:MAG: hypothetical protein HOP17_13675 [Acidobacteria bacterium]|nr:hypothetical protein [Acidobacteriota bacterium]
MNIVIVFAYASILDEVDRSRFYFTAFTFSSGIFEVWGGRLKKVDSKGF